jgi:hypothetical protein
MEEVTRQHRRRLRAQELPPSRVGVSTWRRRDPQPPQNAADRRRPYPVTKVEQLALDSLVSPAVILPGHARDQRDHRLIDGPTPEMVGIGPLVGDQATMPVQDRARRDQAMLAQHRGQRPDQRGKHRSIRPVQARLRIGSAQHRDFVAQHQEFNMLRRRRATEQQQQIQ